MSFTTQRREKGEIKKNSTEDRKQKRQKQICELKELNSLVKRTRWSDGIKNKFGVGIGNNDTSDTSTNKGEKTPTNSVTC